MNIKNIFFFLFPILILNIKVFSQEHYQKKLEKFKEQKIEFFTEKLELTEEEAKDFWPVFNDYENRRNKIIQDKRNLSRYLASNIDNISDKEIEETTDKYVNYHRQETELLEEYYEKFKGILPVKKVMKVFIADHQFKKYLLKQLKNITALLPHHAHAPSSGRR